MSLPPYPVPYRWFHTVPCVFSLDDWARPIFGLASDFKSMTRDEREERDYANLSQEARHRIR